MLPTVIEATEYQARVTKILTAQEREQFNVWIAHNPLAGDLVVGTGGMRKVRWGAGGKGKSGGARIIYFEMLADGVIILLTIYSKSERASLSAAQISAKRKKSGL
ncbi:hypothetical protein EBQ26_10575 [Allofranklinella schreckenbergeri]|uniref:Addiction module toxin RelE n=1 Tax=Allofranklinella schreckenbergeri TaxID=1076744 RepID=A0A3M6QY00_9BURK|nr:hypothetical protein [Allofranklinella schreckenbergeri]RMW96042.1 hypothetical protein EBQ26_10575 [Allofranklinella schreckenbergeri]RMX07412.1 hypothetical protein EBQ24_08735 [Allofranklinella schreckenbergeri]